MLDSLENLYMLESNFEVDQQFLAEEVDTQREMVTEMSNRGKCTKTIVFS
jgi:hypothetical protein